MILNEMDWSSVKLKELIEDGLAVLGEDFRISASRRDTSSHLRLYDAAKPLSIALKEAGLEDTLLRFDIASVADRLRPDTLAFTLLLRTIQSKKSSTAIEWLHRISLIKSVEGSRNLVVYGVSVPDIIDITSSIKIVPYSTASSWLMLSFVEQMNDMALEGHIYLAERRIEPELISVISVRFAVDPLYISDSCFEEERTQYMENKYDTNRDLLERIRQAMSLFVQEPPHILLGFSQFEEGDLQGYPFHQGIFPAQSEFGLPRFWAQAFKKDKLEEVSVFSEIAETYTQKNGRQKDKLEFALDRLESSTRRNKAEDAALEIASAFESLVAPDPGESRYKIALRVALLVESQKQNCLEARKYLNALYDIRSKWVHQGLRFGTKTINGAPQSAEQIVHRCRAYLKDVICILIKQSEMTEWQGEDWAGFELSKI